MLEVEAEVFKDQFGGPIEVGDGDVLRLDLDVEVERVRLAVRVGPTDASIACGISPVSVYWWMMVPIMFDIPIAPIIFIACASKVPSSILVAAVSNSIAHAPLGVRFLRFLQAA